MNVPEGLKNTYKQKNFKIGVAYQLFHAFRLIKWTTYAFGCTAKKHNIIYNNDDDFRYLRAHNDYNLLACLVFSEHTHDFLIMCGRNSMLYALL